MPSKKQPTPVFHNPPPAPKCKDCRFGVWAGFQLEIGECECGGDCEVCDGCGDEYKCSYCGLCEGSNKKENLCEVCEEESEEEKEEEVIYYFLKDYTLTQTEEPFNPQIHEWEMCLEVDGRIEKTYKRKNTDEGGNSEEEEDE